MKKLITIFLTLFMLISAAACQPTPEQAVVVKKDMERMIDRGTKPQDANAVGRLRERLNVPERLTLNEEAGKLSIVADVPLEVPEASGIPMMYVEAGRFSQEQVYTFFNTLCAGKPMYLEHEQMDKPQIEQAILEFRAEKTVGRGSSEFWDKEIARLEKMYRSAPEKNELIASDGTLLQREITSDDPSNDAVIGTMKELRATSNPGSNHAMTFGVYNDADYKTTDVSVYVDEQGNVHPNIPRSGSNLSFQRSGYQPFRLDVADGTWIADVTELSLTGGQTEQEALSLTPTEARAKVEALMETLGLNEFIIDRIILFSNSERAAYEAAPIPGTNPAVSPADKEPNEKYAYVFSLLRTVQGFSIASTFGTSQASTEEMGFGKEWDYEYLTIAIDDSGIVNLYWHAPLAVTDTITENANLLPWAEVEATLLKMLSVKYMPLANGEGIVSYKIELTRARLSLQRVMERNNFTSGLLIPVWNFYGRAVSAYASGEAYDNAPYDGGPLLSINAIDGSIIDLARGY